MICARCGCPLVSPWEYKGFLFCDKCYDKAKKELMFWKNKLGDE